MTWTERHACAQLPTTGLSAFMAPTIADFGNNDERDVRGYALDLSIAHGSDWASVLSRLLERVDDPFLNIRLVLHQTRTAKRKTPGMHEADRALIKQ